LQLMCCVLAQLQLPWCAVATSKHKPSTNKPSTLYNSRCSRPTTIIFCLF
ncbi:uncharacterized protein M421DRAFT_423012, partial [Didymella exigua CBS 183.55]